MSAIVRWLEERGLGRYAEAFVENEIELDVLPDLSEADLEKLGIPMGPRKRLLKAIAALALETATGVGAPAEESPETVAAEAERRQLTVMFVDLVGSTALSGRLDPEDLREVMRRYQDAVAGAVTRYSGHVAKYLGDGVLVYFGWPRAHEDQAERAVRAGLDAVATVSGLKLQDGVELEARVGIATGQVVVGDLVGEAGRDAEAVTGETPNLASRLQEVAGAGQVAVGEATRRLIGQAFDLQELGARRLKGFTEPVPVWLVAGERAVESRFEAGRAGRLTTLVGREHEIGMLMDRWEQAKRGEGQVVLLSGEAGIGKSRMAQTLRERIADEPHTRVRFQCSPYYTSTALYPFISQLERAAAFAPNDQPEAKLDKLEALLSQSTEAVDEVAPLVAALLSLATGDRYRPLEMTPQRQKEGTLEALTDQLLGLAARQSVLLIFEDVHWVDPTSLEALEQMIDRVQGARVLAIITHRPEFAPPWRGYTHMTSLSLNRLGREQCAAIVGHVSGKKALPNEVLDQIVAKTDGVPLFVEELTKTVLESGLLEDAGDSYALAGPLPPLAIPSTLQDSLMARLDRLAPVKEVAQIGAAIGREFSYRLLAGVSLLRDNELNDALGQLVESELVFRRGTGADARYTFKHALVQDAAYESLLKSTRQEMHSRIAEVLEERFPETKKTEPELLAHHYTVAGLAEPAVNYWTMAGSRSLERSATYEAVRHFHKALELLADLPDKEEGARREINIQMSLGGALLMTKGHGSPEVETAFARARELCLQVGEQTQLTPALVGLWRYASVQPDLSAMQEFGEQLYALGESTRDPANRVLADYTLGLTYFCYGDAARARSRYEEGAGLYVPEQRHALAFRVGQDPGVACLTFGAWALWVLGYPESALRKCDEALALAKALSHPFSLAFAHCFAAMLQGFGQDAKAAHPQAEIAVNLSKEQEFPLWAAIATSVRGWALSHEGALGEGIDDLREGIDAAERVGVRLFRPYILALLAETCGRAGMIEEAFAALDEALDRVERTNERWWESHMRWLKGNLTLQRDESEAEAAFQQALEIARVQGAKSLELRAATSLARLWRDRGQVAEARDLLAPVHNWFTEGFDTADLKEAKALLDALS